MRDAAHAVMLEDVGEVGDARYAGADMLGMLEMLDAQEENREHVLSSMKPPALGLQDAFDQRRRSMQHLRTCSFVDFCSKDVGPALFAVQRGLLRLL